MSKTLMILAHPKIEESIGNSIISKGIAQQENAEVRHLDRLYPEFEVDVEKLENLASKTSKSNFNYILKSFPIGITTALLLIFSINLVIDGSIPNLLASIITGASILISYYFLVKNNSNA